MEFFHIGIFVSTCSATCCHLTVFLARRLELSLDVLFKSLGVDWSPRETQRRIAPDSSGVYSRMKIHPSSHLSTPGFEELATYKQRKMFNNYSYVFATNLLLTLSGLFFRLLLSSDESRNNRGSAFCDPIACRPAGRTGCSDLSISSPSRLCLSGFL